MFLIIKMASTVVMCCLCSDDKQEKVISCDSCQKTYHVGCANISGREVQCLEMKKRAMSFYCPDCKNNMQIVPKLFEMVKLLEEKFSQMMDKMVQCAAPGNGEVVCQDMIMEEIEDRRSREGNVIIYNIPESTATDVNERIDHDKLLVSELVSNIFPLPPCKVLRLGKKLIGPTANTSSPMPSGPTNADLADDNSKPRPMKVIFDFGRPVVEKIFQNFKKLKLGEAKLKRDLTTMQREKIKAVYEELEAKKAAGEKDIFVRFVNNVPKLVQKPSKVAKN